MHAIVLALLCAAPTEWTELTTGIEYRRFTLEPSPGHGDGVLHVVRIDPARATLELGLRSEVGGQARTAAEWARAKGFVVTINAGMFDRDGLGNVGHLHHGSHVNKAGWNAYQSVLLLDATDEGAPAAALVDRDAPGFDATAKKYGSALQNLRLIKRDGVSVWKPNGRRWSEAMIASDRHGRLVFLFTRTPWEMAALNERVLALPLGIVRAMHAEGGPEASLSIHSKALSLDLCGSFETGFQEDDSNGQQWPIPNVLGAR